MFITFISSSNVAGLVRNIRVPFVPLTRLQTSFKHSKDINHSKMIHGNDIQIPDYKAFE